MHDQPTDHNVILELHTGRSVEEVTDAFAGYSPAVSRDPADARRVTVVLTVSARDVDRAVVRALGIMDDHIAPRPRVISVAAMTTEEWDARNA